MKQMPKNVFFFHQLFVHVLKVFNNYTVMNVLKFKILLSKHN